jgi:hypothetical protein
MIHPLTKSAMAVNDAHFDQGALEAARGSSVDTLGWAEYNGGILMPKRTPVPLNRYIYRFASSRTPHTERARGCWWIEFEVLNTIRQFIRQSGGSRREAVRYLLALPWSWSGVDRVLRARVVKPLDAYRGLGKSAQGNHPRDASTIYIPPQHLKELYQLYIPGMRELSASVLTDVADESVWTSERLG